MTRFGEELMAPFGGIPRPPRKRPTPVARVALTAPLPLAEQALLDQRRRLADEAEALDGEILRLRAAANEAAARMVEIRAAHVQIDQALAWLRGLPLPDG